MKKVRQRSRGKGGEGKEEEDQCLGFRVTHIPRLGGSQRVSCIYLDLLALH